MTNSDALVAYKMIGAERNLLVKSVYAPAVAPRGSVFSETSSKKRGPNRGIRPLVDPEITALKKEIQSLNAEISAKSIRLGGRLSDDDELIIRRGQLFRVLKSLKDRKTSA
jgi:hypothetical protein